MLSYSDFNGGAARATFWLAKGLRDQGIDVELLVEQKVTDHYWVKTYNKSLCEKLFSKIEHKVLSLFRKNISSHWSLNLFSNKKLLEVILEINPDLINIHWVGNSFLPFNVIKKFKKPLVWSLYDMWPLTAGCHYDNFCNKFINGCNNCPQINDSFGIVDKLYMYKLNSLRESKIHMISPSRWLSDAARNSRMCKDLNFEIDTIPHGTDLNIFKRIDKKLAREILNIPIESKFLLFGSMSGVNDLRKGFQFLIPALKGLFDSGKFKDVKVLIFGESPPKKKVDIGFDIIYLGRVVDDIALKVIYSAADLTITPSMQEAFGMTASESMACGTPVVAFNIAGAKDVVDHKINGYLVEPFCVNDLMEGISWGINSSQKELSLSARIKCEDKFNLEVVAKNYLHIFEMNMSKINGSVKSQLTNHNY